MKPSFSKFISILALFSLITPSSADYIRYSLAKITSIEPREWNDDNLMTILNIVSSTQNVTKPYTFDKWHRGRSAAISNVYKDFPLTGNEPVITASFGLYNVGDKDPQKYGLSK